MKTNLHPLPGVHSFSRQDYVEEAWRIVDSALQASTPGFEYEPKTWEPAEVARVSPPGGWHNPLIWKANNQ